MRSFLLYSRCCEQHENLSLYLDSLIIIPSLIFQHAFRCIYIHGKKLKLVHKIGDFELINKFSPRDFVQYRRIYFL